MFAALWQVKKLSGPRKKLVPIPAIDAIHYAVVARANGTYFPPNYVTLGLVYLLLSLILRLTF